jgi:hypothetical protein
MFRPLALMLPALVPSWRFFDVIAPSPRVHFRLIANDEAVTDWHEFKPRPAHVSSFTMLARMLWNASWNEQLFVMSCAERILTGQVQHSDDEIARRIRRSITASLAPAVTQLQFKLMLIERVGNSLQESEVFMSSKFNLSEIKA